jgi:hypothetical protein
VCFGALRARHADLDPILGLPYRPAACELPHYEAGHTKAPDHTREPEEKTLASNGASAHEVYPVSDSSALGRNT